MCLAPGFCHIDNLDNQWQVTLVLGKSVSRVGVSLPEEAMGDPSAQAFMFLHLVIVH